MMQCTKFDESLDNTVMETAADFEAKVREVHWGITLSTTLHQLRYGIA